MFLAALEAKLAALEAETAELAAERDRQDGADDLTHRYDLWLYELDMKAFAVMDQIAECYDDANAELCPA